MPSKPWREGVVSETRNLGASPSKHDLLSEATAWLEQAFPLANTHIEVLEQLRRPKAVLQVSIPVRMDDGMLRVFEGFRVRHNDARGPTKGGVRYHPHLTVESLKGLSLLMTLKCAVAGIPFGGAYGGIALDAKELSRLELERVTRGYIEQLADFIGPEKDILDPDLYTNPMVMGWMADEYSRVHRQYTPAVITGKPKGLGGTAGHTEAIGQGALVSVLELQEHHKWDPKKMRVAVQGFGKAGQNVAALLQAAGYKIVAVSDSKGGIYRKDGFEVNSLIHQKNATRLLQSVYCSGSVCQMLEAQLLTNDELLEVDCDILALAAVENQITEKNSHRIKAKYILEVANGPISLQADTALAARGTVIIPDILASAGGANVCYFEWVQNKSGLYWTREDVHARLKANLSRRFKQIHAIREKGQTTYRMAAYAYALAAIGSAIESTGTHDYFGANR